jgi:hypothetical protein
MRTFLGKAEETVCASPPRTGVSEKDIPGSEYRIYVLKIIKIKSYNHLKI